MPPPGTKPADAPGPGTRDQSADVDRDPALKSRRKDPHGQGIAGAADQDEPKASPTADRQKVETTTSRIKPPGGRR